MVFQTTPSAPDVKLNAGGGRCLLRPQMTKKRRKLRLIAKRFLKTSTSWITMSSSEFGLAAVYRVIKKAGADRVGDDAAIELRSELEAVGLQNLEGRSRAGCARWPKDGEALGHQAGREVGSETKHLAPERILPGEVDSSHCLRGVVFSPDFQSLIRHFKRRRRVPRWCSPVKHVTLSR